MDDFLSVSDLDADGLDQLLGVAADLKRRRGASHPSTPLDGRTVAMIFEKPSTRTRVSFEVGIAELGGHPLALSSSELQLGRGETVADTGEVLARYVHAIVVRTFGQDRLIELAAAADVPVVNALTDLEHPCQALADLLTLVEEFGDLRGRALAYVGDGNNVCHSLLLAGALAGMSVRVATPDGHGPEEDVVATAKELGGDVLATVEPAVAVDGAAAVYTDVWTSMGQESEADRAAVFASYRVDETLMDKAAPDAIFLHCLPAHRGEEVTAAVIDGPASRVFDQAENRLHVQKALLVSLLGDSA